MAMAVDRSKYRNPDMPDGYEKKESEIQYRTGGIEIDGVHLVTPTILGEDDVFVDDGTLSDLILSDDEKKKEDVELLSDIIICDDGEETDDVEILSEKTISDDGEEGPSTSSNTKKTKKDTIVHKKYTGRKDIDYRGYEKKKTLPSPKKLYGSDSSNSSSKHNNSSQNYRPRNKHAHSHSPVSFGCEKKIKTSQGRYYRNDRSSSSSRHSSSSRKSRTAKKSTYSDFPMNFDYQKSERNKASQKRYYRSDSSSSSSTYSSPLPSYRPRKKNTYSQLPKVKQESCGQSKQQPSGAYFCNVCNIDLNSILSYNIHVNGKRHMKNLKQRAMSEVKTESNPVSASDAFEEVSKYPKPVDGVIRKKVETPAKIQQIIEEKVKRPCIGLNAVTEIQGLKGVQYYCSLCNITCFSQCIISHLTGHNHMKQSARKFHPNYKEIITGTPKPEKENKILELLKEIQNQQGMGKMTVEVEELDSEPAGMSYNVSQSIKAKNYSYQPTTSNNLEMQQISSSDYQNKPSTSMGTGSESSDISELYNRSNLPKKSAPDFYCQTCQSHMNSRLMWNAHINGKRHRTNLKKFPGDAPSKTKTARVPNKRAALLDRLKIECPKEPIVGLEEIQETELPKLQTFTYKCFLCGCCPSAREIVEHLLSLKHRIRYLNHIEFPNRECVDSMSDALAYPLVSMMCEQALVQKGRGEPEVHVLKSLLF